MSTPIIEHWIDGAATPATSDRTNPVYNPATGEVIAEVTLASAGDVRAAVDSARKAFESWSQYSVGKRASVLFRFRELLAANVDELARIVSREHGKVISDAKGEIARGLEVVEFATGIPHLLKGEYSDQAATGVDVYSFRQPLGVVAGITPFNFPVMVPLWMSPIAIATGNAFILKPSERDPSASLFLADLWAQAGLPSGVFTVLQGDKVAVDGLLHHPDVAAVSFVGSTPIARYIHETASAQGKRVQALGGAKNHAVVLADADLDLAADQLTAAAFGAAGERCMAVSVAVVEDSVADSLVDVLATRARAVRVTAGDQADADMGPVITAAAKERIESLITSAADAGAELVVDGRGHQVEGYENGFFVGPTVIDRVTPDLEAYREEIFGPVIDIVRVTGLEEAVGLINANPYGNGTAIFTSSGEAARTFTREVSVGMVGVNVPIPVPVASHSFGGWKQSLFGETHVYGPEGIKFYTRGKVVTQRWPRTRDVASPASFHFSGDATK
ncbi:CoA-acylating methylmalonate-semialdehyde dehydrogenase [Cellulomonas cellasea]|uniref:methylmalonate-semialdehyde dehydrogenase (CoA acylating) n=1 Tax=Cellulomonas cellasea TaxID=43670 RepID=A0A7W4UBS2_9CELL|nr:CoA-acylating methylmalonate-semialdehyde dehydrogenase [Cellulomonas cellasea]MBB2921261.1 malonate-semialdehyde dehydrogenase (acetylating)/methylmalonate-semialdehyde dehydrogenase [Cellulomonas cellasea]